MIHPKVATVISRMARQGRTRESWWNWMLGEDDPELEKRLAYPTPGEIRHLGEHPRHSAQWAVHDPSRGWVAIPSWYCLWGKTG